MDDPSPTLLLLACAASFCAGFVDAFAGGGGLIQLPALLALLPGVPLPVVLGTNKGSAVFGTSVAAWRYARAVPLPWRSLVNGAIGAFFGATLGATLARHMETAVLQPVIWVALVGVATLTIVRPDFGRSGGGAERPVLGAFAGAAIGLYDGLIGPGTGTFLVAAFITFFSLDFLRAAGAAKVVNVGTNLGALVVFAKVDAVWWALALPMAAANMLGATLGAALSIRGGAPVVRRAFQLVSVLLILKLGYSLWSQL